MKLKNFNLPIHFFFYILNDNGRIFATELIRRMRPIIFLSISSKLFPCVSGTLRITKINAMPLIAVNVKNAPPNPNKPVQAEER